MTFPKWCKNFLETAPVVIPLECRLGVCSVIVEWKGSVLCTSITVVWNIMIWLRIKWDQLEPDGRIFPSQMIWYNMMNFIDENRIAIVGDLWSDHWAWKCSSKNHLTARKLHSTQTHTTRKRSLNTNLITRCALRVFHRRSEELMASFRVICYRRTSGLIPAEFADRRKWFDQQCLYNFYVMDSLWHFKVRRNSIVLISMFGPQNHPWIESKRRSGTCRAFWRLRWPFSE